MDLSGILGAVTSGVGGGIIGGVLGLGKKFLADRHEKAMLAEKRLERAADRAHDIALADKEIERDMKAADAKLDQAMFEADTAALSQASAAQDQEISALGSTLADCWPFVRSLAALAFAGVTVCQKLVRIVLTVVLVWQTFEIFTQLNAVLGGLEALKPGDLVEIYKKVIYSILGLTGIAVSFWYVSRPEKTNRSN